MRRTPSLMVSLSLVLAACTSGYSSGVTPSKPVSELTNEEAELACESLSDYLLDLFPESTQDSFNCYFNALLDLTRTPAECQEAYTDCMRNPPNAPLDIPPLECSLAWADPTCDATVAEVEACVTADTDAYRARIVAVDCSAAGNIPELQRLAEPVPVPDECAVLSARCPTFGDGLLR